MAKNNQEVIFDGWLTKSPPTKRIWRARWRRRWFSLTHSGELPGQFVLSYYTDRNCRHLKGVIDLDHCEQVDLGLKLEKRKLKFDHVFDIKTPNRTYYLAADTEKEMRSWVKCICKVCGLKSTSDDDDPKLEGSSNFPSDVEVVEVEYNTKNNTLKANGSPPISPVSTSPYIPISECISGKVPLFDKQDINTLRNSWQYHSYDSTNASQRIYLNYVNDLQSGQFYDSPRKLAPSRTNQIGSEKNLDVRQQDSPLQSPTDSENVFTENWPASTDTLNNKRHSSSSVDLDLIVTQKFTKTEAPPRPPKPVAAGSPNYLNLSQPSPKITNEESVDMNKTSHIDGEQKILTDDFYDFPRSHHVENETLRRTHRHCYNNAAPVNIDGQIFKYDISPKPSTSQVFRYDLESTGQEDPPASPHSQGSSAYSNLPSPALIDNQIMPPPVINRDLKPRRKLSDSHSICSNEPPSPRGAPSVDRKLKPLTPLQDPHSRRNYDNLVVDDESKKLRAAPSPQSLDQHKFRPDNLVIPDETLTGKMQYLDLDLYCKSPSGGSAVVKSPPASTVYKQVDFMKTLAFNITRSDLEKKRKQKEEPVSFHRK